MAEEEAPEKINEDDGPEEGLSEAEKAELLASLRERIETGDLDESNFHSFVMSEVYPLLADGTLDLSSFEELVQMWAVRNNPYDWTMSSYS